MKFADLVFLAEDYNQDVAMNDLLAAMKTYTPLEDKDIPNFISWVDKDLRDDSSYRPNVTVGEIFIEEVLLYGIDNDLMGNNDWIKGGQDIATAAVAKDWYDSFFITSGLKKRKERKL